MEQVVPGNNERARGEGLPVVVWPGTWRCLSAQASPISREISVAPSSQRPCFPTWSRVTAIVAEAQRSNVHRFIEDKDRLMGRLAEVATSKDCRPSISEP